MSYRKRTIEVTVRLTVDEFVNDKDPDAQDHKFFWEQNNCISDELELLAKYIEKDNGEGLCNICQFTKVKMLELDAPEGYVISQNEFNLTEALE